MDPSMIQELEINLLLETLYQRHGHDFRGFSRSSLKRRILQSLTTLKVESVSELIPKIIHDETFLARFISALTVTVSTMFRDPLVFLTLRDQIIPLLKTYPFVNIWLAGCANGEEAYSMAILLQEEKFSERAQIYATDLNGAALCMAVEGKYPSKNLKEFSDNYWAAGGRGQFSDFYQIQDGIIRMSPNLQRNVLFTEHNLVRDAVFAEMHLILCRNVLIYFDRTLQNRVLGLFLESLVFGGLLCLGNKETLDFTEVADHFTPISDNHRIYRKGLLKG